MNKKKKTRKGRTAMVGGMEGWTGDIAGRPAPPLSPAPDLEKYRRHVVHFDMPEEEKTELLRTIWRIMQNFVDRAFGEDSVQLAVEKSDAKDESGDSSVIPSAQNSTTQNHQDLSGAFTRHAAKGKDGRKDRS